ncbi:MAG: sulfatase [Candidatus Woesearchaeota archaeon]|nr:sulfatase [Candidatus Woesearchaeota archaeon]
MFFLSIGMFYPSYPDKERWIEEGFRCSGCNVVLITLDALRSDHLGSYGYGKDTSPNIDGLAAKGVLFKNSYSNAPVTSLSLPSLMTSHLPRQSFHDFRYYENSDSWLPMYYINSSYETLSEVFQRSGYKTAVFFSNPFVRITNSVRGFNKIYENIHVTDTRSDADLIEMAQKSMSGSKRHFVWIHLMSPHAPYSPPYPFNQTFYGHNGYSESTNHTVEEMNANNGLMQQEIDFAVSQYDGEISYADNEIGKLLDYISMQGYLTDTLIIISSDHGESFGEHDLFMDHGELYDTNLKVPLIIYNPHANKYEPVVMQKVSLIDIYPTILEIVNLDQSMRLEGRSMVPVILGKDRVAKPVVSIAELPYTLYRLDPDVYPRYFSFAIHHSDFAYLNVGKVEELYNLTSDISQKDNLFDKKEEDIIFFRKLSKSIMI